MYGVECLFFQVRASYDRKPCRQSMIEAYGAPIDPSPSDQTQYGRSVLQQDPDTPGSLGIAISEAIEVAATNEDVRYSIGSVLNHVLMRRTVIGEEALKQLALVDETERPRPFRHGRLRRLPPRRARGLRAPRKSASTLRWPGSRCTPVPTDSHRPASRRSRAPRPGGGVAPAKSVLRR